MKKAYRFNWIDALVCLLLVALAAGAVYKFTVSDKTSRAAATDTITYVVQIPAGKDSTLDSLRVGDTLFDSDSGNAIGTIQDISSEPALRIVTLPDGTAEWGEIEGRYDAYITVEAAGSITADRQYLINRTYQVQVGAERSMNTRYRSFIGMIWDIL